MSAADVRFAEFIDATLSSYWQSRDFRYALHAEAPGAPQKMFGVCPPAHKHGETGTCYMGHGCRCADCRSANSKRAKRNRMRRSSAAWNENRKAKP